MELENEETVKNIPKIKSGIKGLDEVLNGGLPKNRTILFRGRPGSGKTLMSLEFLYRGAKNGEPGIFVGFEETVEDIKINAATLGWNITPLIKKNKLSLIQARIPSESILSGDFNIHGLLSIVNSEAKKIKAKRIVFDALDVLLRLFQSPIKARAEIHAINEWIKSNKLTSIVTIKPDQASVSYLLEEFFESMSDCVIDLESRYFNHVPTRRLKIVKYRGSSFGRNEYPYSIGVGGTTIIPITNIDLKYKLRGKRISTGIKKLDKMLGGGFHKGSALLLSGLPGTGKTIFSTIFAENACRMGDKVLHYGLEESGNNIIQNVKSIGVDLKRYTKEKKLRFLTAYPEAMGSEEHLVSLTDEIDRFEPDHLIIDSISACSRMGGHDAAFDFLARIINYTKLRGITLFMLNQMSGTRDVYEISGNNISSMIDIVIFLSYHESHGSLNRLIHILKTRGSASWNRKMEFVITNNGILISEPLIRNNEIITGEQKINLINAEKLEISEIEKRIKIIKKLLSGMDQKKLKSFDDKVKYNSLTEELSRLEIKKQNIKN